MTSYTNTSKLLYTFYNSFGIPAHREKAPDDAKLPYLVYNVDNVGIGETAISGVTVYTEGTSYTEQSEIVDRIEESLPAMVGSGNEYLYIEKGDPFAQDREIGNDLLKGVYVNFIITMT